jgi:2-polyprenyl-3-methyl-5-hydroxy-6-metoxy-1,4-benzoquinol methylase
MNELGSLIPSSRREKTKEPDFGTYHHSTSVASKEVRIVVKAMFTDAFASLPLGRDDELRILDVGCGLGFLSCASAEFYKNARVTGIDRFEHVSVKRSSTRKITRTCP